MLPEPRRFEPADEPLGARSDLEQQLVEIWREVLKRDQVGIRDNFFDLGGDSMRLVAVLRKMEAVMRVSVRTVEAMRYPTIEQLARVLNSPRTVLPDRESTPDRAARLAGRRARRGRRAGAAEQAGEREDAASECAEPAPYRSQS